MAPRQAGFAVVPTSLTGFAFSLGRCRESSATSGPQRTLITGMSVLAAGFLWPPPFTVIGISVSGPIGHTLGATGFSAAVTAAAVVALATAALGTAIARTRH
jgi:hypothetical protein